MTQLPDGALVLPARDGDGDAFGELVRRYQKPAYFVALSVTANHQDAEDAAQEAFLIALERLNDCRDPKRFGGWLMSTVRNRSKNIVRREVVRAGDPVPETVQANEPSPARATRLAQLRDRLREAMNVLTEVQREVVLLHDLEGWKHKEIAARLGIPSGTVRSHLHFARKALRAELADWKDH